jgi:3-methyladenine DNA glycosylase AlkD
MVGTVPGWDPEPVTAALLHQLQTSYAEARDPERAARMKAYLRDQFEYFGLTMPQRRAIDRQVLAGRPKPDGAELRTIALACWELPEREFQYFGTDLLVRYAKRLSADFLPTAEHLITTRSWWDTVDALATRLVGSLVRRDPSLTRTMDAWIADQNIWLVRTALLHQLTYREATDTVRLFRYCRTQAGHPDFFVRKAIGWALRQYARTDPDAVRRFVAENRLSPLSIREATKHL